VIHRHDCYVFAQLNHGGSRVQKECAEPVGPSSVVNPSTGLLARELNSSEIWEIIDAFGRASARVREAGLDGILIHGAHGYLASLFTSPFTNHRTDEWGGDALRRFRFLEEVYRSIRKTVGSDYPVAIKLGIKDDTEEGLPLEEGAETAGRLARVGIDAIEISAGVATKPVPSRSNILSREQEAYFLPYAKAVRPKVGKLPLSLVGGLRSPDLMEEIIKEGWTDFVSLARPFICEPDLVNKIRTGRSEPVSCTRDDRCRTGMYEEGLRCRRDEEPAA
jgi:2,4-dienoyl-CoA reductase-like NADH-dependent reductase (Old Yellow Enzyme family)